jgi:hypothetical protein
MLERTREEVRALHARAFAWDPPDLGAGQQLSTTRIRQYVRRWINEWDLKRAVSRLRAGYGGGGAAGAVHRAAGARSACGPDRR